MPETWDYNYNLTYLDFNKPFKYIDDNNLPNKEILPALKLFFNRDMQFSLGSISNFKRKIQRYFKRNEHDVEYLNLPVLNLDASSHSSDSIGPYCDKISFTKSLISSHSSYSGPPVLFSNGSVLEISKIWVKDHGWGSFSDILSNFCQVNAVSEQALKRNVDTVSSKASRLRNEARDDFLSQTFTYEINSVSSVNVSVSVNDPIANEDCYESEIKKLNFEIQELISLSTSLQSQLNITCECLKEEINKRTEEENSKQEIIKKLHQTKQERDILRNKLTSCFDKLGNLSTRNVNKRIQTRKSHVQNLKEKVSEQEKQIGELENENKKLDGKLQEALKTGLKERKQKYYLSNKLKFNSFSKQYSQSYVDELNEQIVFLQNEKLMLEEQLDEFMSKKVSFCHNGKYDDCIRMLYQDLMCTAGLSARNVQHAIEVVLKELAGIEVEQLPKTTFANYMLLEARMLAQIQVADELTSADFIINEENTLHSDGTSKKGHSYLTYDIKKNDGTVLVAGLRSVGGGDAQTQLNTLKEVVKDLGESVGDDNHFVKKVFCSIKNLMSDRCATQKKFNKIFTEFKC